MKCLNVKHTDAKRRQERVSERKEIFPNANTFSAKRKLAMKWLHNIGTGYTVEKCNFNRKMFCQDTQDAGIG